jgi:formylglycine-generating enzyme required for sulfatase activity
MKRTDRLKVVVTVAGALALIVTSAHADTFGSGVETFSIDFVTVGNPGNGDDRAFDNAAPDFSSPYGGVPYVYRMGVTEVSQDMIVNARVGGANVQAGPWSHSRAATYVTWYEAAEFVNWLNTSTGHQAAYDVTVVLGYDYLGTMNLWSSEQAWQLGGENLYRNKDAYYFLPNEDEWYKAAYHKNDGVTANYWDYATGSNSIPTAVASGTGAGTAVYNGVTASPAAVDNSGGLSAYGTRGQGGNVFEWNESAYDGLNDSSSEPRVARGGDWNYGESNLRSSRRDIMDASNSFDFLGFRVASVPEPSAALLTFFGLGTLALRRRR